ncbi:MAG: phosphoserine transaminase [Aeromicrobium sp.]
MKIPAELLPSDGRFGSGPSKVRVEALDALAATGTSLMGTSHRQSPVTDLVGSIRAGIAELLSLPEGYEVVLGIGGSTAFFDAVTFGLIRAKSQHLVHGEFTSKFANSVSAAPFLDAPSMIQSDFQTHPTLIAEAGVDTYVWAHNETSTGVMVPVERVSGADEGALMVVDATSAVGGLPVDITETDVYFFAPQKGLASDGGLWLAAFSPAAIARAEAIKADGRYIPPFFDLVTAIGSSRKNQTYNTPSLASLFLIDQQVRWILDQGGLGWATKRTEDSSTRLYEWAEASTYATPFITDPADRSHVVGTIDFEGVDAKAVSAVLRDNGIVDIDGYRGLGRNQLRVAMFPAIEPADITKLTSTIDWVVANL